MVVLLGYIDLYNSISRAQWSFGWSWANLWLLNDVDIIIITIEILYEKHLNSCRWWACPLCKVSLHCVLCMRNSLSSLQVWGVPAIKGLSMYTSTVNWFRTWINVCYKEVFHYSGYPFRRVSLQDSGEIIVIHMHCGVYKFYKPEGPRL